MSDNRKAKPATLKELRADARWHHRQLWTRHAKEQVRRELAVWFMAVRGRIEELATAVDDLREAVKDKESLLHDEVELGRLTGVYTSLAKAAGDLDMFFPEIPKLPDVVAVAQNYQENWVDTLPAE